MNMQVFEVKGSAGFVAVARPIKGAVELSIPDLSGAFRLVGESDDLEFQAMAMYMDWLQKADELGLFEAESIVPVNLAETQRLLGMSVDVPADVSDERE